jgi:uncharacterized protein YggE
MKKNLIAFALLIVLLLSACTAPVQSEQPAAPAQQQSGQTQIRTISVNGSGQVTLAPDLAYVYIGVRSQAANVADALSDNNEKAQAIAASLQEMGIETKDIQTSSFNIYPQQNYGPTGEMLDTVYVVDNTVYVTVRDLQSLGQLLDVVTRSGANSVNGISFDVNDKSQAISEARRLAVESARAQAEEMAAVAGVELGELQTMNVYTSSPVMSTYEGKGAAMDASSVPISAGQMIVRVEVNAVYVIR